MLQLENPVSSRDFMTTLSAKVPFLQSELTSKSEPSSVVQVSSSYKFGILLANNDSEPSLFHTLKGLME